MQITINNRCYPFLPVPTRHACYGKESIENCQVRLITVLASLYLYQYQHVYRLGIRKYLDVPSTVTIINLERQDGMSENLPLFILEKIIFRTKVKCSGIFYGNVLSMQAATR